VLDNVPVSSVDYSQLSWFYVGESGLVISNTRWCLLVVSVLVFGWVVIVLSG